MDSRYVLHTPLMWIDKAETWKLTEELGGAPLVSLINQESHTCYLGDRGTLHPWGHGCGECPACALRRAGWEEYVAEKTNA
ncbi:Queuosine Biosynthesis QueC ATPase [Acetobacter malorum]|nr:Queuosine Biosynthesis QueC ATPase [Acetobacter malorum]